MKIKNKIQENYIKITAGKEFFHYFYKIRNIIAEPFYKMFLESILKQEKILEEDKNMLYLFLSGQAGNHTDYVSELIINIYQKFDLKDYIYLFNLINDNNKYLTEHYFNYFLSLNDIDIIIAMLNKIPNKNLILNNLDYFLNLKNETVDYLLGKFYYNLDEIKKLSKINKNIKIGIKEKYISKFNKKNNLINKIDKIINYYLTKQKINLNEYSIKNKIRYLIYVKKHKLFYLKLERIFNFLNVDEILQYKKLLLEDNNLYLINTLHRLYDLKRYKNKYIQNKLDKIVEELKNIKLPNEENLYETRNYLLEKYFNIKR